MTGTPRGSDTILGVYLSPTLDLEALYGPELSAGEPEVKVLRPEEIREPIQPLVEGRRIELGRLACRLAGQGVKAHRMIELAGHCGGEIDQLRVGKPRPLAVRTRQATQRLTGSAQR